MDDVTGPSYSKRNGAGTCARIIGDTDRLDGPEEAKDKVDITMSDMTNKTPILISY